MRRAIWDKQRLQTKKGGPTGFLIEEADAARDQGKLDQAKSLYEQALPMLSGQPQAATVLMRLGTIELANKNIESQLRISSKLRRWTRV